MSPTLKKLFFLFLTLVILVGLSPRFLQLETLQTEIINRLNQEFNIKLKSQDLRWDWLPFPHLTLLNVQTDNPQATLQAPEIRLYPHWQILLGDTTKLGKIHLQTPTIHIKDFTTKDEPGISFPKARIIIEHGQITVPGPGIISEMIKTDDLVFSAIQATINVRPDKFDLNFQATTPFSKKLTVKGNCNTASKAYRFTINTQGLQFYKRFLPPFKNKLAATDSGVDLSGTIKGVGLERIWADLKGQLPNLVIKNRDQELGLICGTANLSLVKKGPDIALEIKDLELKHPGIHLNGRVARTITESPNNPNWLIELGAQDLDLDAIRRAIMILWPDNHIAAQVCSIVLGGRSRTASFKFNGPLSDLSHLSAMKIAADVTSAALHIPHIELDLTEARGSIQIEDGILSGQDLAADHQNSHGNKANIVLGLTPSHHAFKLDLDLDVALTDLKPFLERIIPSAPFTNELKKLAGVDGRATGHLRLGDRLHHLVPQIRVDQVKAAATYERLPWRLTIDQGQLAITPDHIHWHGLQGTVGPHLIRQTDGALDWQAGPTTMEITKIDADLDTGPLHRELISRNLLSTRLAKAVTTITGSVQIRNSTISGPASNPAQWNYDLHADTNGLRFASPLTPGPVTLETGAATINPTRLNILNGHALVANSTLDLQGSLTHETLANWEGRLKTTGTISRPLTEWVQEKKWLPSHLTLRTPLTLKGLTVSWQENQADINGEILARADGSPTPRLILDARITPALFFIRRLQIISDHELGQLSLSLPQDTTKATEITWNGTVDAATLNSFLATDLQSGRVSGILSGRISPLDTYFTGELQADTLVLINPTTADAPPIHLGGLRLIGWENGLNLEEAHLAIDNQQATTLGRISFGNTTAITLKLNSSLLFEKTIRHLADRLQRATWAQGTREISGEIGFDLEKFMASRKLFEDESKGPTTATPWSSLKGRLQFTGQDISISLTDAEICGLQMAGTWHSDPDRRQTYTFKTPTDPLLFQEVLPCLGIEQDVIEGAFKTSTTLTRQNGKWLSGTTEINSTSGAILRMKLLAAIFKVINITDLFTEDHNLGQPTKGFAYTDLDVATHITDDTIFIDRMIVKGKGLNLFGKGNMNLSNSEADFVLLIAPLKTLDAIVSRLPLIGRVIGGANASLISIPVGIKGNIKNPTLTALPPEAIGDAIINLMTDALKLPFSIIAPIWSEKKTE